MKLQTQRNDLLGALQAVIGVVERRQTMPILSNLLLKADNDSLSITATDLELELVTHLPVTVDQPGAITVPARKLLDICRGLPDSAQIAVAAKLAVTNLTSGETRRLRPIYMIMQDRSQQYIQNRTDDWGLTVTFAGMNVDTEEVNLIVEGVEIAPEDWVIVRASVKPFINVLWLGIILLAAGFLVALARRIRDLRFSRRRRQRS
jgi:hypothetical protein